MVPPRRRKDLDLPPRVTRKHGAVYYLKESRHEGKRRIVWIRLGKAWDAEAKKRWLALSEEASQEPTGAMGVLIDRYLREVAVNKAPRSYRENLNQSKPLRAFFGPMNPRDVKPKHIYAYLDMRGAKAPRTANLEKALLSHIFTMAIRWGVIDANPCRDVKNIKIAPRDRYITDEEFDAVRRRANDTVALVMDFAYLTGQRIGDILTLKLVDVGADGIAIQQAKTGKRLVITWTDELRGLVQQVHALGRPPGEHLFRTRTGTLYTYFGLRAMFRRAVDKAKVKDFRFHDIRAKALTDHKRQGGDAQSLAGHASSRMTDHYVKRREVEKVAPVQRARRKGGDKG